MTPPRRPLEWLLLLAAAAASLAERPAHAQGEAQPASAARSLTLDEALRAALLQQPQLLAARAEVSVADAEVEQARSPFFPQLTASGQYTYGTLHSTPGVSNGFTNTNSSNMVGPPGGATSVGASNSPTHFVTFTGTATQLIYDFGQTAGRYGAATKTREAQQLNEATAKVQVLLNVRRAYFVARANRELVDVARETLDNQKTHLKQVQGFVDVGTQPEIALAQQKAAVANAQVQLITAQNNYDTARAQLNQAAGIPGGVDYDVVDNTIPPVQDEEDPLETLVTRSLQVRPEMASLVKQRESQNDAIAAARGGYGPTLSAVGTVGEAGALTGPEHGWGFLWQVGANLTWPIFQGGLTQGQVRQAEATLDNLDAQQSLQALQVRLDVNSAQLAVRAAKATIGAAQDAAASAHEQLRLAEQRLR
ncbi:MAG: TolC family protein, partial [Polyangiaceae bacterium]|nr:TolC family protein [Polyangiaceae bacterium]